MTRDQVFRAVVEQVQAVLPDLPEAAITEQASLAELGASSIDRVEVSIGAMEALGLALPLTALAGIASIGELVDRLAQHGA